MRGRSPLALVRWSRQRLGPHWPIAYVLLAIVLIVLVRTAWLCDDSYITFRTVDNLLHGNGLRWNVDERVDAYTHPLWLIVMTIARMFSGEVYWTALIMSIGLSVVAATLLLVAARASLWTLLFAGAALVSSRAFIDYSTSGLENALSHALLGAFFLAYWSASGERRTTWLAASFGLILVNRMDLVLLVLPALVVECVVKERPRPATILWALGPFVAWEVFSVIYYGFPFPNTAYAKLSTGVPTSALVRQSAYYFLNSLRVDRATLVIIVAAIVIAMWRRVPRDLPIVAGLVAYLAYIAWIGGDFMSGRFFAAPFFTAIWLIAVPPRPTSEPRWVLGLAAAASVALAFTGPYYPPLLSGQNYGRGDEIFDNKLEDHGINDERRFYYPETGLLLARSRQRNPDHPWADQGREARVVQARVVVRGNIGFFGFVAGPVVHVIDYYALADPLLAHLPAKTKWRIGHFVRVMPAGYPQSVDAKRNLIEDPDLATFYDHLRLVTSGPIWSVARLKMIARINLGRDAPLLARYEARLHDAGIE